MAFNRLFEDRGKGNETHFVVKRVDDVTDYWRCYSDGRGTVLKR